jgi:integrase
MASIKRLTTGHNAGKWKARYRDESGKEHAHISATKTEGQAWLDSKTAALVRGEWVDPSRSKLTVGAWSSDYMTTRVHLKPKTVAGYESLLATQILPRWDRVGMVTIRHQQVVAWVAAMLAGGLSASRARQAYHLFSAMLDAAVRDRRLPSNPADGVELPRLPRKERRYLDHDQLAALAEQCGTDGLVVLLLGYCGPRWGELAALRVKHVNVLRRRLEIVESMTEVNGRAVFGTTKTHERRSVPVPAFLADELARRLVGRSPDELVFRGPRGGVLRVNSFRRATFDAAARAAGLDGFVPHELRHTAASLAIAAGANIKVVQTMLGHRSATQTWDRYGHLYPDDLDAVAERLDAAARERVADLSRTNRGPGDGRGRRERVS